MKDGCGAYSRQEVVSVRNTASDRLTRAILAVALVGVAVAGYLTYIHYAGIKPICAASGGCEKVHA